MEATAMSGLDEMLAGLGADEIPVEIDFNAPESGQYPPAFAPGVRTFVFHLLENEKIPAFERKEIKGQICLQVNYVAEAILDDGSTVLVPFQNASTYKTDRMANSRVGDLLFCLGFTQADFPQGHNANQIVECLVEANSRARTGRAEFGWSVAFKDALTVYKTSANKVRRANQEGGYTTMPWPRREDGSYLPQLPNPLTGQRSFGRLEIVRLLRPITAA